MAKTIQLFNFCKSGIKKVDRSFNLGTPLDVVSPVGLSSLGCQPLVSHRSDAGHFIFSQVKQNTGAVVRQLLTTPNDSGIVIGTPTTQCLPYGALIAGLQGATPLSGSAANPFPTTEPDRTLLWTVGNAGFAKVVNGTAQSLTGDPTAFDLSSGNSMAGFGGTNGGSSGAATLTQLPPDNREYGGLIRLRAYHSYVPTMQLPYSPLLEPLLFAHDTSTGYYITPGFFGGGQAVIGTNGTCDVEAYGASVAPCLTVQNGVLIDPTNSLEMNGPSLHRKYNAYRLTPFTLPGFAGSFTATWDVPAASLRTFLCVYVSSSRIDSVTCHEGALAGTTAVTLPTPGNGPPSAFSPVFPGIPFDTMYQFSVNGNEAGYTFDVTRGATTITTSTNSYHVVSGSHVRAFEVFLDLHKSGNVSLVC